MQRRLSNVGFNIHVDVRTAEQRLGVPIETIGTRAVQSRRSGRVLPIHFRRMGREERFKFGKFLFFPAVVKYLLAIIRRHLFY
jgi:hypothetical protein